MQAAKRSTRKKEQIYLRVIKGGLVPADAYAQSQLRAKNYNTGDVISADLKKLRNTKFNRLVHRIGQLIVANLDAFSGMDAHKALKRIQLEANIACEEIALSVAGVGMVIAKIPQSLSFESMDEGQYHEVAREICRYIAERYWPTLSADQIEEMAESFVQEG